MGLFDKIVSIVGDNIPGGTEHKDLMEQAQISPFRRIRSLMLWGQIGFMK